MSANAIILVCLLLTFIVVTLDIALVLYFQSSILPRPTLPQDTSPLSHRYTFQ